MEHDNGERIDRWLWATRFFKTRRSAVVAIRAGHVLLNERRVRPANTIRVGDSLRVRREAFVYHVEVRRLIEKRVSALEAANAYLENTQSRENRLTMAYQLRLQPQPMRTSKGRPGKRARRALQRLRYVHETS